MSLKKIISQSKYTIHPNDGVSFTAGDLWNILEQLGKMQGLISANSNISIVGDPSNPRNSFECDLIIITDSMPPAIVLKSANIHPEDIMGDIKNETE